MWIYKSRIQWDRSREREREVEKWTPVEYKIVQSVFGHATKQFELVGTQRNSLRMSSMGFLAWIQFTETDAIKIFLSFNFNLKNSKPEQPICHYLGNISVASNLHRMVEAYRSHWCIGERNSRKWQKCVVVVLFTAHRQMHSKVWPTKVWWSRRLYMGINGRQVMCIVLCMNGRAIYLEPSLFLSPICFCCEATSIRPTLTPWIHKASVGVLNCWYAYSVLRKEA